jgi:hypothetical protein
VKATCLFPNQPCRHAELVLAEYMLVATSQLFSL